MKPAILAGATLAIALCVMGSAMAQSYDRSAGSGSRPRESTGERVEGLLDAPRQSGKRRRLWLEHGDGPAQAW